MDALCEAWPRAKKLVVDYSLIASLGYCVSLTPAVMMNSADGDMERMSILRTNTPFQKLITGYRPVVHAREGRMLGIRQPLDGPIFQNREDAEYWCSTP